MLRNELQERVNKPLENWQWEMAEYVYMNHDSIKDVGGKNQIADIIKLDGFGYKSTLDLMYAELFGPAIIKCQDSDLYSTWDVTHTGYCINEVYKPISDVIEEVLAKFRLEYTELFDKLEYLDYSRYGNESLFGYGEQNDVWPRMSRNSIYYVRGGSEGYYIHVDIQLEGKFHTVALGKTLLEGKEGHQVAGAVANALTYIME